VWNTYVITFGLKILGVTYFLGNEVAQSKKGIVVSQRKYALDILEETCVTDCRLPYRSKSKITGKPR